MRFVHMIRPVDAGLNLCERFNYFGSALEIHYINLAVTVVPDFSLPNIHCKCKPLAILVPENTRNKIFFKRIICYYVSKTSASNSLRVITISPQSLVKQLYHKRLSSLIINAQLIKNYATLNATLNKEKS